MTSTPIAFGLIPFSFTILTNAAVHPIPVPGARRSCMDSSLKIVVAYGLSHTYENTKKVLEEAWPEVLQ